MQTLVVTPSYNFANGEKLTPDILRLIAKPTVTFTGSVDVESIPDLSIATAKLANLAVTTAKIADLGVSNAKLAAGAVSAAKTVIDAAGYGTGVLGSNIYVVTLTNSPQPASYVAGQRFVFKADVVNTGATEVDIGGLGPINLYKNATAALIAGDIPAGAMVEILYDGTHFQLAGMIVPAPLFLLRGATNFIAQRASVSTVTITSDELILKDSTGASRLVTGINVTGNMATTGAGGRDAGSEASSTWYYLWIISDGTTPAALISTSSSAPTLPTGYTFSALVGAAYNNSGSDLVNFFQLGRRVWLNEAAIFTATTGVLAVWTALTTPQLALFQAAVPPIAKTAFGVAGSHTTASIFGIAADTAGLGASYICCNAAGAATNNWIAAGPWEVPLKTAQTIYWVGWTGATNQLSVLGFTL